MLKLYNIFRIYYLELKVSAISFSRLIISDILTQYLKLMISAIIIGRHLEGEKLFIQM